MVLIIVVKVATWDDEHSQFNGIAVLTGIIDKLCTAKANIVWCSSPRHRYFCTPRNGARANARLAYSFGKNERFGCRKRFPRGLVEILKIGGVIFGRHDLDWPSD